MKTPWSQSAIGGVSIVFLCLLLSACGKNPFITSGAELFRGKYCTVYSVRDDGSGKEGVEVKVNGLEKKDLDSDVTERIKERGGKGARSVNLGTIEYNLMVVTPEGEKRSYGIPAESMEELESCAPQAHVSTSTNKPRSQLLPASSASISALTASTIPESSRMRSLSMRLMGTEMENAYRDPPSSESAAAMQRTPASFSSLSSA